MIEKIIKTYKFEELDENLQQKILEKNSDINVDYDWWDYIYEDINDVAEILGINIKQKPVKLINGSTRYDPAIWFTGFYHQGEGSAFDAEYSYAKGSIKKIKKYAPDDKELHRIAQSLFQIQSDNFFQITVSIRSYRDSAISVSVDRNDYKSLTKNAEEDMINVMNDFNHWIFKRLKEAFNFLTSEEVIKETIISNDYDFDEYGNLI